MRRRRRRWVGLAVCAVTLAGCGTSPPPNNPRPLVERVSGQGALQHMAALQRIADANGGNRATPSPGYDASVDYVARVLRTAGYAVTTPTYPISDDGPRARDVVAQTRTGSTDHVVMLGAHLDSVPEGPGINDNGSGVAALLEIATKLGPSPLVRNAVRFAFWGSEEDEYQGSTHYVDTLSQADRDHLLGYVNVDMLASPNAGYFVLSGDTGRSRTIGDVLGEQLTATGVRPTTMAFDGESDFVPFVDAHIPSGSVQAGDEARKTSEESARWGGTAGVEFDPCYHSPCDRFSDVNTVALNRYTDALAGTLAYFAATDGRPSR
jgi:aminopeptidase S